LNEFLQRRKIGAASCLKALCLPKLKKIAKLAKIS
jgi:hypothetical protein